MDPELRASDADREQVVADLQQHAAAGRLSLDEYAQRVDQTLVARTHGDLAALTSDLPAAAAAPDDAGQPAVSHQLAWAFLLSIVVLVVLGAVFTLAR